MQQVESCFNGEIDGPSSSNWLRLYTLGGSRNCLKEGVAAYHVYFCPPFDPERRDYNNKNNPFLVKFSDRGGGGGGGGGGWWLQP